MTLSDWLTRLESIHPRSVELGLERVGAVWQRLGSPRPAPLCVVIGGTNGKGSTVAFVEAALRAAGHRVGTYTSPHLLRYQERVRIQGAELADADWVAAFERIEAARAEISLSYFEFGTLAAINLMARAGLDAAVLEIGLGGRLDAVNLIDADVAILTSVDLDHQDYLGDTREQIGWEKAHIFRAGRPAVVAEQDPPASIAQVAVAIGAELIQAPVPAAAAMDGHWTCVLPDQSTLTLPRPRLAATVQTRNAAAAVTALWCVRQHWRYSEGVLARGVASASVRGRMERLARHPETWVDVAHNPEAARALAAWLRQQPATSQVAVFAALADKDLTGIVAPLADSFSAWVVTDLSADSPRAQSPERLAAHLRALLASEIGVTTAPAMQQALASADALAGPGGRVIVFGSFFTVAAALRTV